METGFYFIPNPMKFTVYKLRRSDCFRGVVKSHMQPVPYHSRKHRAALVVFVLCPGQEIFVEIQSRTMRLGSVVIFVAYGASDGAFPDVVDVESRPGGTCDDDDNTAVCRVAHTLLGRVEGIDDGVGMLRLQLLALFQRFTDGGFRSGRCADDIVMGVDGRGVVLEIVVLTLLEIVLEEPCCHAVSAVGVHLHFGGDGDVALSIGFRNFGADVRTSLGLHGIGTCDFNVFRSRLVGLGLIDVGIVVQIEQEGGIAFDVLVVAEHTGKARLHVVAIVCGGKDHVVGRAVVLLEILDGERYPGAVSAPGAGILYRQNPSAEVGIAGVGVGVGYCGYDAFVSHLQLVDRMDFVGARLEGGKAFLGILFSVDEDGSLVGDVFAFEGHADPCCVLAVGEDFLWRHGKQCFGLCGIFLRFVLVAAAGSAEESCREEQEGMDE